MKWQKNSVLYNQLSWLHLWLKMAKKSKRKGNLPEDLLKNRKNHQRIPLNEQLNVIEKLESGICQAEIVRSLGLSKSTVSQIFKNSDKLKTIKATKTVTLKSKVSNSRAKYPELDKLVYEWFSRGRAVKLCQHFWKFPQLKRQKGKSLVPLEKLFLKRGEKEEK
jgi:hypothetical protein